MRGSDKEEEGFTESSAERFMCERFRGTSHVSGEGRRESEEEFERGRGRLGDLGEELSFPPSLTGLASESDPPNFPAPAVLRPSAESPECDVKRGGSNGSPC